MSICWLEEGTSWALQMSHQLFQKGPCSWWGKNSPGTAIRDSGEEGMK